MNVTGNEGAVISRCKTFRYVLWRVWDFSKPTLVFVMLNPSTADERTDDPTIRKCVGFARREDFGAIVVLNLFAYRATDPKHLVEAGYQTGPENDSTILQFAIDAAVGNKVCCAWGSFAKGHALKVKRVNQVIDMLRDANVTPHVLELNEGGHPAHPLMLGYDNRLKEWKPWEL